ncbi:MAG: hypothetical protein Q4E64_08070 [Phascolarctobacterium sp.]|uniref:hypothetical protein n=1 Tax=Phascolarctobacterium sp. TaxID=2049039 RepID=UPI0026DA98C4|nr:hypothetical protein [Phascolarctobacterium sp.]MDO4921765.1 hypothetical protein [Phascolarctobacterium sp.]
MPNIEFFLQNYVSDYQIKTLAQGKDKFICSAAKPVAQRLSSKVTDSGGNPVNLATAFANIDLSDEQAILRFCNAYGLPYSSQKCLDLRKAINSQEDVISFLFDDLYLNEMLSEQDCSKQNTDEAQLFYFATEVADEDIMPLILFQRCVKITRCILTVQNWLQKHEGSLNSIVHSLAYLLYFAGRGTHYLALQPTTPTLTFSVKINVEKNPHNPKLLQRLAKLNNGAQLIAFIGSLDGKTLKNIKDYDSNLITQEAFNAIVEADIPCMNKIDRGFAQSVVYDIVNDGLGAATSKISVVDNAPAAEWSTAYLMSAIYLDLYYSIIYADTYKKCRNPQCGKYFLTTGRRADAVYCSNACASKMGKKGKYVRISKQ